MRCQSCDDYPKLYRSVARSRAWIESSIRLLQEEVARSRYVKPNLAEMLEQPFASYFLELFITERFTEDLKQELVIRIGAITKLYKNVIAEIIFVLAERLVSAKIYQPVPPESAVRNGFFLRLGQLELYSPRKDVSLETLLRYELVRRAWRIDWSLCPGLVVGGLPTQLGTGEYYSLFDQDQETLGVLTEAKAQKAKAGKLLTTILSFSSVYNQQIVNQLTKIPDSELLFFSDNDRAEDLLPKEKYWRIPVEVSAGRYIYLIGNGSQEIAKNAFIARVPGIPTEELNFESMFNALKGIASHPPVEWARSYRNHDRDRNITPNLKLGLVKRAYPKDYLAADSISDVFSFRVRMQCHTTNRKTGRDQQSPIEYWARHRFFTNILIENNKLHNQQALIDYVYDQTKRCGLFNAALSTYVYARFAGKGSRILDGFAGWGDRLIAAAAAECSEYHGFDTNPKIPYTEILAKLKETVSVSLNKYRVEILPFEKAQLENGYYDLALLSPPFFQYEIYTGTETSTLLYKKLEDWLENFWRVTLEITLRALRVGGWLVLYIPAGKDKTAVGMMDIMHKVLDETCLNQGVLGYAYTSNENAPKIRQSFVYRKL